MYPLKNPAKPNGKSSGTKQIIFIGGVLMTILYFRKNPEQIINLKDKFHASMIFHCDPDLETIYKKIISWWFEIFKL